MKMNILSLSVVTALLTLGYVPNSYAEWHYGIGTGFTRLNIEGDVSVASAFGGTITADVDLDPNEISDAMESAIGFAGYATDGTWTITYSYASLELEGNTASGATSINIIWEKTTAELMAAYPISKSEAFSSKVLFGIRNIDHDLKTSFTIPGPTTSNNQRDNNWVDGVIGITADLKLTDIMTWTNQLDISAGNSEGITNFKTGLNWRVAKNWTVGVSAKASAVEVEEGNPGDASYYVYDADETSIGASFLYHF